MDERPFSALSRAEQINRLAALAESGALSVRPSWHATDDDLAAMTDTVLAVLQAAPQAERWRRLIEEVHAPWGIHAIYDERRRLAAEHETNAQADRS